MPYQKNSSKKVFTPRKPVRSFRDLEVYQKMLECSVIITKNIQPKLLKLNYQFLENMVNNAMSIPLLIAEAHSLRFADFALGVGYLEKAMTSANKMVVYLEHTEGLYGSKIDLELIKDIVNRYITCRVKMFHLEKSWRRFRSAYNDDKTGKGKGDFKY